MKVKKKELLEGLVIGLVAFFGSGFLTAIIILVSGIGSYVNYLQAATLQAVFAILLGYKLCKEKTFSSYFNGGNHEI